MARVMQRGVVDEYLAPLNLTLNATPCTYPHPTSQDIIVVVFLLHFPVAISLCHSIYLLSSHPLRPFNMSDLENELLGLAEDDPSQNKRRHSNNGSRKPKNHA